MALSNPREIFGIHSVTPYNRTTGEFYGELRVLGSSSINISGELIKLNGGSNKYPWAIEEGLFTAELSLVFREYPDFVFELFGGKAPTSNAAEAAGSVNNVANKNGVSIIDATNGISAIAATASDEADLKFGSYVLKAISANTAELYVSSDIDLGSGNAVEFSNDLLLVETVDVSGGDHVSANLGLTFTQAGTPAFVVGDTATFKVRPINTKSTTVRIGGAADIFPEFGAIVYAKKSSDGKLYEFDLFRVKAAGLPIGLTENAFSEASVTAEAFYDSSLNGVFDMTVLNA